MPASAGRPEWDNQPTSPEKREANLPRYIAVGATLCASLLLVALTGDYHSPFKAVTVFPVLLMASLCGVFGGVGMAIAVSALLAISHFLFRHSTPFLASNVLIDTGVLLVVGTASGLFAKRLIRTADHASSRARRIETRAAELEWFIDTAIMMESLQNLENMLSVVLLRLGDVAPCDAAAVYLRGADDPVMRLVQTMGLPAEELALRSIPLAEQVAIFNSGYEVLVCPDTAQAETPLSIFAQAVPRARSLAVVPLRNRDDLFGILIIGANTTNALRPGDLERLSRLARHMVYPIQRLRLQELASTDPLTGLFNRRAFWSRLKDEGERTRRYRRPLALLMMDIDHFKQANDTFGHPAGDALLAQLGGLLQQFTRGTDVAARYGGEELAILCPETDLEEASLLAERIREHIAAHQFRLPNLDSIHLTVSVGIATIPHHADDETTLVKAADAALYRAKARGRNRTCVSDVDVVSHLVMVE